MAQSRSTPRTGGTVRGSTTGRPLMAAMDLLGRRWALRLLWELRDGPLGARVMLSRCEGLSSSVLYERLRQLSDAALVTQDDDGGYRLTDHGKALGNAIQPLDAWAIRWSRATNEGSRG